jgi:hypothetical protein
MHSRKALTLGAAVLAAGLLALTATAANATGGSIASVWVNGGTPTAAEPITGIYAGGGGTGITYGGGGITYMCTAGSISGSVNRGPVSAAPEMSLSLPSFSCLAPWGSSTFTASSCSVSPKFTDPSVNNGTIDSGTGIKLNRVDGSTGVIPCWTFSGGVCQAKVVATNPPTAYPVATSFDEAITTVSGVTYQKLIFNGMASQFYNQSPGCLSLLTSFEFKDFAFWVKVAGGTTTGIDFRP